MRMVIIFITLINMKTQILGLNNYDFMDNDELNKVRIDIFSNNNG